MKKTAKSIVPLTALAIVLLSLAPTVVASTLTVNLNPTTRLAKVDSVSTTTIVFTYPAGSSASKYLENVSSSVNLNSTFTGGSSGAMELQNTFDSDESHVSVNNMTVALHYTATGNATELVIDKVTNVTAWVSGVFSVVNGSVVANMRWRSFVVRGAMDLNMGDHMMDINMVGSTVQSSLASSGTAASFLLDYFGGRSIWNQPTLNFTQLDTPLSTWTRNYDAGSNTTTFTKTIAGTSRFASSIDFNGQNYSLTVVSDPTGVVAVQGYASPQGDLLVMTPPPASSAGYVELGAVVVLAAAAGYFAFRSRSKQKAARQNTTLPV
ncbi:MAG: hypothetical protein JRM99_01150 [Nitrososphaerota archaeon]|nr:hypothetical protein [Nitrososphaerota archaeon]